MKLTRIVFGQETLVAEGDPDRPSDRDRLSEAFADELAAGNFAFVPTGLDSCCRRGVMLNRFTDVPPGAPIVQFLKRQS